MAATVRGKGERTEATTARQRESRWELLARLLRHRRTAETAQDEGRDRRQVGVVSVDGRAAQHTGSGPGAWAGHRSGPNFPAKYSTARLAWKAENSICSPG